MIPTKFNKLLEEYDGKEDLLLRLYCMGKFEYLFPYQVNKIIKLIGEKKYPQMKLKGKKVEII